MDQNVISSNQRNLIVSRMNDDQECVANAAEGERMFKSCSKQQQQRFHRNDNK